MPTLPFRPAILVGLLAVSTTASAGVIRSDRPDSLYLELANDPGLQSVGRFTWQEPGGSFLGSGVLISDEWVLTAAHVIDGTDNRGAGVTNLNFDIGGSRVSAAEWIPHPGWAATGGESNLFAGFDIGLVRLSRDVTNTEPAPLFTGRDELGQTGTISGFGATGTGATGATGPSGTRRAGQNVVDVVGGSQSAGSDPRFRFGHDRLIAIDFDEPGDPFESTLGGTAPLDLEYLTAPGDSGGGLFLEVDGQLQVAGITSLGSSTDGDGANSDYGDRASFSRVSSFLDFIETTTGIDFTSPPPLAPLLGDFDGDGVLSLADFDRWRDEFGRSSGPLTADGNGDGIVDAADFTLWRDAFAAAGGSSAEAFAPTLALAVPEPGTAALALSGLLILTARRR